MIERRFITKDEFNKFKAVIAADEERKSAHQDITKQVRQLFSKMQDMDASQLNLENDLGNVRVEMRNKANLTRVEQIEVSMSDFAGKTDIQKIINKLESYTTLESFNKTRINQEKQNHEMQNSLVNLVAKPLLAREVESMKEYVGEVNKSNSQKRDCLKDKKELEKHIEKLQKELLDLRDDHRNSKERIRNLETLIGDKVNKVELDAVKEYQQLLPTKEEVTQLRNYMKSNIDKFAADNDSFQKDFSSHLAIIRRYDEVLAEKASKHSVYAAENRVNEFYKPVIKELDERISTNLKLIHEQKDHFTEFKELISAEVYSAVKKSVIKEIKMYEHEKIKS